MKPCKHQNYTADCRICFLYENDPRYKKLMDKPLGIVNKVINLAGAIYSSAKTGFKRVPLEVFDQRKEHCDRCIFNVRGECIQCGCPLNKRLLSVLGMPGKLDLASEACPMGYWGKYEESHAD